MRCRGLLRVANPPYLSGFFFSGLLCVAPYCASGGIRVVSGGGSRCGPRAIRVGDLPRGRAAKPGDDPCALCPDLGGPTGSPGGLTALTTTSSSDRRRTPPYQILRDSRRDQGNY